MFNSATRSAAELKAEEEAADDRQESAALIDDLMGTSMSEINKSDFKGRWIELCFFTVDVLY